MKRAFTLIELLVTIAILATLASLLLGAIARAKAQAAKVSCMNNLRQQFLAWQFYSDDNNGILVPNHYTLGIGLAYNGQPHWPSWVQGSMADSFPNEQTNTLALIDRRWSRYAPYISSSRTYKCPADRSSASKPFSMHARARSYSMNEHVGGNNGRFGYNAYPPHDFFETLDPNHSAIGFVFRTEAHFSYAPPARIWLNIDEHPDTISAPAFRIAFNNARTRTSGVWLRLPALRHGKATPITFADGHCQLKLWKDPRTRKPVEGKTILGIITPNNPDHDWLQEHSSVPRQ